MLTFEDPVEFADHLASSKTIGPVYVAVTIQAEPHTWAVFMLAEARTPMCPVRLRLFLGCSQNPITLLLLGDGYADTLIEGLKSRGLASIFRPPIDLSPHSEVTCVEITKFTIHTPGCGPDRLTT